jgi:hypothetical protein
MDFTVTARDEAATTVAFVGRFELNGVLAGFLSTGGAHLARRMMKDFGVELAGRIAGADPADRAPAAAPVDATKLLFQASGDAVRSLFHRGNKEETS